jgi:methyl acetate hydrolase
MDMRDNRNRGAAPVDDALAAAIGGGKIAGIVAAAADADGVLYEAAAGRLDLSRPAPMTRDAIFRIASMTKAITATAAMQLVEQGLLSLDRPAEEILPFLTDTKVLIGFDSDEKPILRAPQGVITLRNLLTHTAGFAYRMWNADMARYARITDLPAPGSGKLAALAAPLAFDTGERWEYGINLDIAGRMVEVVSGLDLESYMRLHIFEPLRMTDTSYMRRPEWEGRLASVHARRADGSLEPLDQPAVVPVNPEFYPGGGGLYATASDYLRFLRALLRGGELDGRRILRAETVATMGENHIGDLEVTPLLSADASLTNRVEFFPGISKKWGLSFLINAGPGPAGRSAGSLAWAGLNNTYYWLDPTRKVAGVFMTQVLPFADPFALAAFDAFESAVYRSLGARASPHAPVSRA